MSAGEEYKCRLNQLLYRAVYVEEADTTDVTGVEVNHPTTPATPARPP